jgi:hypothetical protein
VFIQVVTIVEELDASLENALPMFRGCSTVEELLPESVSTLRESP